MFGMPRRAVKLGLSLSFLCLSFSCLALMGSFSQASGRTVAQSAKAEGAPITVMTINHADATSDVFPEYGYVANAYEKAINAAGGIKDASGVSHKLKVILCEDQNDPNQDAACGRKAVADHVTAVVSAETLNDTTIIPIVAKAHIAWFGDCCGYLSLTENSPDSFDTGSSNDLEVGIGSVTGAVCKSVVFVGLQGPFLASAVTAFKDGLKSQGKSTYTEVDLPATATDYTTQVQQVLQSHPACIAAVGLNQANWFAFLPALQQAEQAQGGAAPRIITDDASLTGVPSTFPQEMQNAVAIGLYPAYNSKPFATYRAALAKYERGVKGDWAGIAAEATWTAYTQFADVVSMMKGNITAETFLKKASHTTDLNSKGLAPPLNFTKPYAKGYTRLFNQSITLYILKNGHADQLGGDKFYNVGKAFFGEYQPLKVAGL
jgi:ABC-type branched-subunit amino acid transport system substrate-binding protein